MTWSKKNDKGFAVGTLNILGGTVPIIVNDYRMSPLDIFVLDQGMVPLQDYFVQNVFQNPGAFAGVDTKRNKSYTSLFGPENSLRFSPQSDYANNIENRRTNSGETKLASVIETLDYMNPDDVSEIIMELQNPLVKEAYEKNGTFEVIVDLYKKSRSFTKIAQISDYLGALDIDRQLVYEENGKKMVKQANSLVNKTWIVDLSDLDSVDIEPVLANTKKYQPIVKLASVTEKNEAKLAVGETFSVFNKENEIFSDFYVTKIEKTAEVDEYAQFKTKKGSILISPDERWEKTAEYVKSTTGFEKFAGVEPKVGDYGVFITESESTEPFEILRMHKIAGRAGHTYFETVSGLEKVAYYPIKTNISEITPHEKVKHAFYVPSTAKFVKLASQPCKLSVLHDHMSKIRVHGLNRGLEKTSFYLQPEFSVYSDVKTEVIEKTASTNDMVVKDNSGLYNFVGDVFNKYANEGNVTNLTLNEAKWVAVHCGATVTDIEALETMQKRAEYQFEGELSCPKPVKEIEKAILTKISSESDKKLPFAKNLTKLAGNFADKGSVDAMLSLNLLRKANLASYFSAIPTYEAVLGSLAKLLIAARMGLRDISADVVKEAFEALGETVAYLKFLESSAKK